MGKGDTSVRQKTSNRDRGHAQENISPVAKVVELTQCTPEDAEFVLNEYDNNVDQAVIAILERPDFNTWKENKKKNKVKSTERENIPNSRLGNKSGRSPRDSQDNRQQNRGSRGQNSDRLGGGVRGGAGTRPERRSENKNSKEKDGEQKENKIRDFPEVDSFNVNDLNKDDDNNWKNGPLVFEASVPALLEPSTLLVSETANMTIYSDSSKNATTVKTEKLSFAAVAAAKKKQVAPPQSKPVDQVQQQNIATTQAYHSLPDTTQVEEFAKTSVSSSTLGQHTNVDSQNFLSLDGNNNTPNQSESTTAPININQAFTDKLKSDIGLHSTTTHVPSIPINSFTTAISNASPLYQHQTSSVANKNSALDYITTPLTREVEFLMGDAPSLATFDFQFGFNLDRMPSDTSGIIEQLQQQHSTPNKTNSAVLSYTDTHNVDYPPNEHRSVGNTNQSIDLNSGSTVYNATKLNGGSQFSSQAGTGFSQQQGVHSVSQASAQQASQNSNQQPSTQSSASQQPATMTQQPPQSQQQSLQQQQHQMYAAQAAQFSNYGFPYMFSPVAPGIRDIEQFTMAPFPYGLNGMNQIDMTLGAMLPPSIPPAGTATAGPGAIPQNAMNTNNINPSIGVNSQNHHPLSQQNSQPSSGLQHSHRGSAMEGKFQPPLQSGNMSNNSLSSLAGNIPYQNLGSGNQQSGNHQSRGQSGAGGLGSGILNTSLTTGNNVAPPPGFSPHFVPQTGLQSLFHMPSYGHPQMTIPLVFTGNSAQQQQGQQRQQPPPQNHHNQHLLQSQNLHQQPQRSAGAAGLNIGDENKDYWNFK